jgi:hypothetical protein
MTDTPKQDETTTPPADDKNLRHPNSMNPHIVPEKEEATEE